MDFPVSYTQLTPLNFLRRSASVFPDKEAVVYKDKRYSYAEFNNRVNKLASALKKAGVEKGDRVAFLCPNIPPMLEAHYGVPLAGGVLVSINTRLSAKEILYILNHSGSKMIFVDAAMAHLIADIAGKLETVKSFITIIDLEGGTKLDGVEYEDFLNTGSEEDIAVPVENEMETITINYTSGTTGMPKGVMYSHRGAYINAIGEALELGMNSFTGYLWTLPMFHCNGWCFTWGVTAVGGTHICLRQVDADEIFKLIDEECISHFCAAPTVLITLSSNEKAKNLKFSRKLRVATAGAPPSPTVIKSMEDMGAEITHVYGLTETYGPHSVCEWQAKWDQLPADERMALKARQGVPYITSLEMRVVEDDDSMNDVPRDGKTIGEIIMRGNNVMKGYFEQPEATEEAFRGGWFHSGDLAVVYPDGYIAIQDRKKDIIISGGENISTVELENILYKHPEVLEVAVVAMPHEKWGEVPKAFITLKPGAKVTEAGIIDFTRENIARYKCPKAVEFCELPKTSTGKIKKFVLREKEWQGQGKRVN